MKRILLITVMTIAIFSGSVHNAEAFTMGRSANGNTLGLIGYWTFDGKDMPQGLVKDVTGAGNHASQVSMATSTAYIGGKIGQAMNFDGIDDYIQATSTAAPFNFESSDVFSFSLWVNLSSTTGLHPFLGNLTQVGTGYGLYVNGNDNSYADYGIEFWMSSGATTLDVQTAANILPPFSGWHHVLVTYAGTRIASGVTIYVDGVSRTISTVTSNLSAASIKSPSSFQLGSDGAYATKEYLQGKLDDVRVYNRVLSAAEVTALYNMGNAQQNASQNTVGGGTSIDKGLVGLWSFNGKDIINGLVKDRSVSTADASQVGMATATAYVSGAVGQALNFDSTNDYLTATSSNFNFEYTSPFSISAWVYWRGANGIDNAVMGKYNTANNYRGFALQLAGTGSAFNDNAVYIDIISNYATSNRIVVQTATSSVAQNTWTHVAATYSGSGSYTGVRIYIDGTNRSVAVYPSQTTVSASIINQLPIRIGDDYASGYFNGKLDEVRIYNRKLSAAEIKQLYLMGAGNESNVSNAPVNSATAGASGLVGFWTFDGKDTNSGLIRDVSGAGNHASSSGIATSTFYTRGKIGQALKFDGVDDYLDTGNASFFSHESTVTAWFKTSTTSNSVIVSKLRGSNAWQFYTGVNTTGQLVFKLYGSSDPTITQRTYTTNQAGFNDGLWHHAAFVVASSDSTISKTVTIYVDSVAYANTVTTLGNQSDTYAVQSSNIYIGARFTPTISLQFDGQLDNVRLYNRALSAAEVKQIYNQGI